jgi:putative transposase
MAQYQITVDDGILQGLLTRNDGLAQLVEQVLQQVLHAQVADQVGAARYERTDERQGYRNGYRERAMTTRIGTLTLNVPRVRDGRFSPELFARYQRSEQALVLALLEMVVNGVSTRKVTRIVEELCGESVSKSCVSSLCQQLDPIVLAWTERALDATAYPFLLVDALVLKVRQAGRVRQQGLLVATGVNADGYREILGLHVGDGESEASWGAFFQSLKTRGLQGVDLVVSDQHGGLVTAVRTYFHGATWQRCQTHFTRNMVDACPKSLQAALKAKLRLLLAAADPATARHLLAEILEEFGARAGKAMDILEAGFDDATAVLVLPEAYRTRLRTTNSVERLNEEIRRRERVIRIFPNRAAAERLLGALLMEQEEAWTTGHRYFDMTGYWDWRKAQECAVPETKHMQSIAA